MKKIVMGIAAIAMAATMFAADFSAALKLQGSLLTYDGTNTTLLSAPAVQSETYAAPTIAMSMSGDQCGGMIKILGQQAAVKAADWRIWFKPVDAVKVVVGTLDSYTVNTETIDYSPNVISAPSWGYAAEANFGGFFCDVVTDGSLLTKDNEVPRIYFKTGYSADFGSITAVFDAKNTFKDYRAGIGFKGAAGSVSYFVDAFYFSSDADPFHASWERSYNNKPVAIDAFVNANIDALGIAVYVNSAIPTANDAKADLHLKAKFSYGINGLTPYLYINSANLLADDFAMTVKPGVTGNLGGMGWEIAAPLSIGGTFTAKVDYNMSINF